MGDSDFFSDLRLEDKTVLFADVAGSVWHIEHNETVNVKRIRKLIAAIADEVLQQFGGRLIERVGDGILAELPTPVQAAKCAFLMHQTALAHSDEATDFEPLQLRIGIHRAEIFSSAIAVYGKGVNLASRLAALAAPGQTIGSASVVETLVPGVDASVDDMGECHLKHVPLPVRAYKLDGLPVGSRVAAYGRQAIGLDAIAGKMQQLVPTLAVLPFSPYEYIDRAVFTAHIGEVVCDRVISALSCSSALTIISRLSTSVFRNRGSSITEIREALGADFIVSGSYFVVGNRLTLNVELCDASSGRVLWTRSATDSIESVTVEDSDLISDLVHGIAHGIFAAELKAVRERPLPNVASHALLLSAISLLYRQSHADFDRSRQALTVLHERAPHHPGPLAWLARWHLFKVSQGWTTNRKQDGDLALGYANRALDIDPGSSLALTMLGHVQTNYLVELDAAEETLSRAVSINPNESLAWLQRGNAKSFSGDGVMALKYTERANELSPLDPSRHFYLSILGSTALTAGNYSKAIDSVQAALRLNVMHVSSIRVLAIAQSLTGQTEQAKQTVQRLMKLDPKLTVNSYLAHSPGKASGLAEKFALALQEAGLPVDR
jgi:adenylate cyclase